MSRQVIINFHGLGPAPERIDADERPYWTPVALFEELVRRTTGRPDVLITFDDGNLTDLQIAAPILEDCGRTAEFYVLTGRLEQPGYLSAGHIGELQSMGMEIGLHGRDHLDWRRIDGRVLQAETVEAREVLAEICGKAIDKVSIPFGAYNRRVMAHLKACGYSVILTTDEGAANDRAQVRARTSIRADMDAATIDSILAGRLSAPRAARRALSSFAKHHLI